METESQSSDHFIDSHSLPSKAKFGFTTHHTAKKSKFPCSNSGAIWLRSYHDMPIRDCVKSTQPQKPKHDILDQRRSLDAPAHCDFRRNLGSHS